MIAKRKSRRRPGFERLEDRALLTAAHVYQSFAGEIMASGSRQEFSYTIDSDFFSPSGRSVLLGFHVRADQGSSLDPAAVQIERLGGGPVTPEHVAADLAGGPDSLALAELGPDSYRIFVSGDGGSSGEFMLDVFLIGDVNGDQTVTRIDAARFAESFAATAASPAYRPEADANLDGTVSLADLALLQRNFGAAIQPARLLATSPANGDQMVNVARETIVRFDERVNPATVTTDSFYLVAKGQRVPGRVVVSSTERFATFFYDSALPSSTEVRIVVDGNQIRGRDGALLDADGDGAAGGVATADFRTLPLTRIPGTNIFGYVYDSYHTNMDGSNIPIVGATIRVDAFPQANTTTDANGYFILRDMPAPDFFVHIDGTTAVNAPPGTIYPSVGKPFHTVPGQEVQLSMGGMPFNIYLPPMAVADVITLDPNADTPVSFGDAGKAELAEMFPELDPAVFDRLSVTFPAGSAVDNQGNPATQAVVIPVPPNRIPAPLPPFMDPSLVISIQAIGATNFDVPAPVTFPNLDGMLPGEQALIMSFDHDAGRWKSIGTGTVSADGLSIVSDPGVGIEAPGWHFPFAGGDNRGRRPSTIPCEQQPDEVAGFMADEAAPEVIIGPFEAPPAGGAVRKLRVKTTIDGPIRDFLKPKSVSGNAANLAGVGGTIDLSETRTMTRGTNFRLEFKVQPKTYDEVFGFGTGGFDAQMRDRLYGSRIRVEVREIDSQGRLLSRKCTNHLIYRWIDVIDVAAAQARSGATAAFHRTFADGADGFVREKKVDLRLPNSPDTTFNGTNGMFEYGGAQDGTAVATWKFDPPTAGDHTDTVTIKAGGMTIGTLQATGKATVPTTINVDAAAYAQELRRVLLALRNVMVPVGGGPGFAGDDDGDAATAENANYGWLDWGPDNMLGGGNDVPADDIVEVVYPMDANVFKSVITHGPDHMLGTADDVTRDVIGFALGEGWRKIKGDDGMLGTADDKVREWFYIVGPRFKMEFDGYLPLDRQDPGPDGILRTSDDLFTADQLVGLDAFLTGKANALRNAIHEDYNPINGGYSGYQFTDVGGDVNMVWEDRFSARTGAPVYGSADGDYGKSFFCPAQADFSVPSTPADCPLLADPDLPIGAKMWALAQGINPTVPNDGGFGVSINVTWTSAANFAQFVANTVSHELGHTFGLIDAYTNVNPSPDPNGTAGCNASGNCTPLDIMRAGNDTDGNLRFLPQNTILLKAALGLHGNADDELKDALTQYRNTFDLPSDEIGVREDGYYVEFGEVGPPPIPLLPEVAVLHGEDGYFGVGLEGDVEFDITVADGAGGESTIFDFEVLNPGLAPLTVADVTLLDGASGYSILEASFVGAPLEPGQSGTLRVAFDPDAPGSLVDTLRISSDAATSPELEIDLTGRALPPDPAAVVSLVGSNNFVHVPYGFGRAVSSVVRIENAGAAPLVISDIEYIEGENEWGVLQTGVGGTHELPITIPPLESTTLGFGYRPSFRNGLERGIFELVTNDPLQPRIRIGGTGTRNVSGLPGDDFIAVTVEGNPPLRLKSNAEGEFNVVLPPDLPYEIVIFDPVSGLVAAGSGVTAPLGGTIDITEGLVYGSDDAVDSDYDGLPDDAEWAIGTSAANIDTDNDGIDDFSEIDLGLDPLDDRGFPTGIISVLPLSGPANEVVVEEDIAYVATGAHGLALVDVSQFNNPIILGEIDLPGSAVDVAVDPALDLAVVATSTGVAVVDVVDPMTPALVREYSIAATHVETADGLAYVGAGNAIISIDLFTGQVEQTLTLPSASPITGLAREGNVLFTMDAGNTLRSIDTRIGEMVLRDSLLMSDVGGRLFVGGGVAYAVAANLAAGGFSTADVSDIDNLTNFSDSDATMNVPKTHVVANGSGQALLVGSIPGAGTAGTLLLMDVTDPENTFDFVTRIDLPDVAASAAIASGIGLIADGFAGLVVVNYLSFDSNGQPPIVTATVEVIDADGDLPGVQVFSGTMIPVRVQIVDDVQVQRAELLVNGGVVASDVSFPFDFFATSFGGATGTLSLQARAVDTGGNVAVSELIVLDVIPDLVPPTITLLEPTDQEIFTAELGRQIVRLRFSEPLDQTMLTPSTFQLRDSLGTLLAPTSMTAREVGRVVQLTYAPFTAGNYSLAVEADQVVDLAGNRLAADVTTDFTVTADTNPPTLVSLAPPDGAITLAGLSGMTLRFSEPIAAATLNAASAVLTGPAGQIPLLSVARLDNDRALRLVYPRLLEGNYQLTLDTSVITDRAGNPLGVAPIMSDFELVDAPLFPDPVFFAGWTDSALVDMNGDGWSDLITVNGDDQVRIDLFGPGGTIIERRTVTVAPDEGEPGLPQLGTIEVADVNGDSRLDLVVASRQFFQKFVATLLGDADGGFTEVFRDGDTARPNSLTLAHMDGDATLDLVVGYYRACCPLPNDGEIEVMRGLGDGTFEFVTSRTGLGPIFNHNVAVADFDEDGDLDVAVGQQWQTHTRFTVGVLFNQGNGTLSVPTQVSTGRSADRIFASDVDGDDNLDILWGENTSPPTVKVIYGDGLGAFSGVSTFSLANSGRLVDLVDVTADGTLDLVMGRASVEGPFTVRPTGFEIYAGDGTGGYALQAAYVGPRTPRELMVADMDRDGDLDLISIASGGSGDSAGIGELFRGNGDGTFDAWEPDLDSDSPSSIAVGDVDLDGDLDLVSTRSPSYAQGQVSIRLGQGNGQFGGAALIPVGDATISPTDVVLGDLDADGDLDAVAVGRYSGFYDSEGLVSILIGNGSGALTVASELFTPRDLGAVALGDLDDDGDLDIVAAERQGYGGSRNLVVLLGNGDGSFSEPEFPVLPYTPASVAISDVDGNGIVDLVVGTRSSSNQTALWLPGVGDGSFDDPIAIGTLGMGGRALVADLDADLDNDVVVVGENRLLRVFLNQGTGTFGDSTEMSVAVDATAAEIVDLDRDTNLDLVLLDNQGVVLVLFGLGDGTFDLSRGFSVGNGAADLAMGDLDGDGDLDLVTANTEGESLSVRLNSVILSAASPPAPDEVAAPEVGSPLVARRIDEVHLGEVVPSRPRIAARRAAPVRASDGTRPGVGDVLRAVRRHRPFVHDVRLLDLAFATADHDDAR
jgi:hypothetical protein